MLINHSFYTYTASKEAWIIFFSLFWQATLPSLQNLEAMSNKITELTRESNEGFTAVCFMHLEFNKIEVLNANFTEKNQCLYQPGVNATLYIYLEGKFSCDNLFSFFNATWRGGYCHFDIFFLIQMSEKIARLFDRSFLHIVLSSVDEVCLLFV